MLLPELEREAIISQRLEEKQRVLDKVNVSIFLKTHRKRPESPEAETVSGAAKRRSKRPMMLMSDGNLNAFNRQTHCCWQDSRESEGSRCACREKTSEEGAGC